TEQDSQRSLTHLDPAGSSLSLYAADRMHLGPQVSAELGLRWDRQTYTGDSQVSPRINATWMPGERTEVRMGVGRFTQSQRIHELLIEDGQTEFLPAELADQAALTVQHRFAPGHRLRLDAYYQNIDRVHPRYENLFAPHEFFPEAEPDRVLIEPSSTRL